MNILIAIIIFIFGFLISTFLLTNIIIILAFSIPITKRFKSTNVVSKTNANTIVLSQAITAIIFLCISIGLSLIVYYFLYKYLVVYLISLTIPIIIGYNQFGIYENNFSDYFRNFDKYINEEKLNEVMKEGLWIT